MCKRKYDIESLAELLFAEDAKHMNIFNTEYVTLFYVLLDLGSAWWDDTVKEWWCVFGHFKQFPA